MQAGHVDVVLDHTPGYPDNLDYIESTDTFWLGLVGGVSPIAQTSLFLSRHVRWLMSYLPRKVTYRLVPPMAGGIEFDGQGQVRKVIVDPKGKLASSTPSGVLKAEHGILILGNLHHDYLTLVDI